MLLIPAIVRPSAIHGCGLFASSNIAKGAAIWRFNLYDDYIIQEDLLAKFSTHEREPILHYGYFNAHTRCHIVSSDGSQYINHSPDPNIATVPSTFDREGIDVALRDIRAGEELTMDYTQFDGHAKRKLPCYDRSRSWLAIPSVNAIQSASGAICSDAGYPSVYSGISVRTSPRRGCPRRKQIGRLMPAEQPPPQRSSSDIAR